MSAARKVLRSNGARAATAAIAAVSVLAGVGIANAAQQDETIVAEKDFAWTTSQGDSSATERKSIPVNTGDTVTWSFASGTHNVESTNAVAADPNWEGFIRPGPDPVADQYRPAAIGTTGEYTFTQPGTYVFRCALHPPMEGQIVVTGAPVEPTPTPTPTVPPEETPPPEQTPPPAQTPPPGTQPGGTTPPPPVVDDHTNTPAPGGGSANADTTKPALSRVKLKGLRRGARVRFRLSEAATVTLQFRKRGARKVLRSVRLQARAGTRTIRVRSKKLRKGRYTVTLTARDAMGNRSAAKRSALRIRR